MRRYRHRPWFLQEMLAATVVSNRGRRRDVVASWDTLDERLARGEITEEEYRRARDALSER
jgi:uncharacterized membrane protein